MARASVVTGLFALGVFTILAAGGIDVSFPAIGAVAMYSMTKLVLEVAPGMPVWVILLCGIGIGAVFGAVNGILVNSLRVPALIVTIGTQYFFRGLLLVFVGTVWLMEIPPQMVAFGTWSLLEVKAGNGVTVSLPMYFLAFPVAALLTWYLFNRTLMGRAIFATGGNADVAARLGYNLRKVHVFAFSFAGGLAGLAGIIQASANRMANPFDFAGTEIGVIAAVVLGGARITGGTGSVLGTVAGVLLVTVVNNVLVLVGIPSTWQRVVVGAFILIAAGFFVLRDRKQSI
ncbi:ABC transporter permease [Limimaricola cinnabarinus]|uniref:Ribose ABC transport system, permease protein RbsC n=1 Tax=Limimaricola cinnabarinus LL-001 TaxID=1337093 RepID=U2Z3B5_9RHOB|nr:ABC transporter permease [Limimaricola cinnabarinus]GAD55845.1 ribose ABC transport system, permease protein RbsC [Limimaricola cinnabarinus LL-001]